MSSRMPQTLRNAIGTSLCLAAAMAAAAAEDAPPAPAAPLLRFTGAPLTRSVRNEADAAIDRACAWLAAKQGPDGSWNRDAKTTAVCLLALAGSGEELPEKERETIRRGVAWLKDAAMQTGAPASGEEDLAAAEPLAAEDAAWCDMALAVLAPDALRRPFPEIPFPANGTMAAACAILERAAMPGAEGVGKATGLPFACDPVVSLLRGKPDSPEAAKAGERIAELVAGAPQSIPFQGEGAERAWWFAHAANRILGGELPFAAAGLEPAAWRESLANAWTVSQQIDERGRGFWPSSAEDTAFAILLLKEL